jgi:hypothetical protein
LPLIFNVVLGRVMRKVQENLERLKLNGRRKILVCGVDVNLLGENTNTL